MWDDPDVNIPWPVAEPVLSAKDQNNPNLRKLLASQGEHDEWSEQGSSSQYNPATMRVTERSFQKLRAFSAVP